MVQVLTFAESCCSAEKDNLITLIEKSDRIKFSDIEISKLKYQYRIYDHPINMLSADMKNLPIKFDTPLRSLSARYSLLYQKERPTRERLKEYIEPRVAETPFGTNHFAPNWGSLESIGKKINKKPSEDNFDVIILEYLSTTAPQMEFVGELRYGDDFASIIVRSIPAGTTVEQRIKKINEPYNAFEEYVRKNPEPVTNSKIVPDKEKLVEYRDQYVAWLELRDRRLDVISFTRKNNRWCFFDFGNEKDARDFHRYAKTSVNKNPILQQILIPPEPLSPQTAQKTWRKWETYMKDYSVEGEFVYYDGKFVTIMKRDGTKEKLERAKLCHADSGYIDRAVKEQEERHKRELEELPEKIKNPFREWVTKIHDYKVEGEFIDYDGKFVTIKKHDGKTEQIEYARLCLDDKNYVQERLLIKKRAEKKK
jgi:hypothetical protein